MTSYDLITEAAEPDTQTCRDLTCWWLGRRVGRGGGFQYCASLRCYTLVHFYIANLGLLQFRLQSGSCRRSLCFVLNAKQTITQCDLRKLNSGLCLRKKTPFWMWLKYSPSRISQENRAVLHMSPTPPSFSLTSCTLLLLFICWMEKRHGTKSQGKWKNKNHLFSWTGAS